MMSVGLLVLRLIEQTALAGSRICGRARRPCG